MAKIQEQVNLQHLSDLPARTIIEWTNQDGYYKKTYGECVILPNSTKFSTYHREKKNIFAMSLKTGSLVDFYTSESANKDFRIVGQIIESGMET